MSETFEKSQMSESFDVPAGCVYKQCNNILKVGLRYYQCELRYTIIAYFQNGLNKVLMWINDSVSDITENIFSKRSEQVVRLPIRNL